MRFLSRLCATSHLLLGLILLVSHFLFGEKTLRAAETQKQNVVFILADDLGWSDTTLYGTTELYQTPNVKRLAKLGMTFTRAYSASPLCSPTRSAIMTGLSPARTGITTPNCHLPQVVLKASAGKSAPPSQLAIQPDPVTRLKTEYRTLAESFQDAGYATGHFGKWHLGAEPYSPLQQGFDVDVPHHPGPGPAGSYVAPWKFPSFKAKVESEHIEDRIAEEAIAWMESNRDKPFFLNYWMFSVHAPFDAKQERIAAYRNAVRSDSPQRNPTYAAMVSSMDDAIGRLLDTLERLELIDNTIIVFTSDNGGNMYSEVDGTVPTSNQPWRGGKATMYEGGTRVPCVICWPGVTKPNSQSDAIIQSEDFYPTLLTGLSIPLGVSYPLDGIDIRPALRGEKLERQATFQYFPHSPPVPDWLPPAASVHQGEWKLIRIFHGSTDGSHRFLLYDLERDPGEQRNLAMQFPDKVHELDGLLEGFLNSTDAVLPIKNPAFDASRYNAEDEGKPKPKQNSQASANGAKASKSEDKPQPELLGWRARSCTGSVQEGIAKFKPSNQQPFLGFPLGMLPPQSKLQLRLRGPQGVGHVAWLDNAGAQANNEMHHINYRHESNDWSVITIDLPDTGESRGILRLFLPVGKSNLTEQSSVEIDWIKLIAPGANRNWDF
jgi:arylsulfatase A-like enzyme